MKTNFRALMASIMLTAFAVGLSGCSADSPEQRANKMVDYVKERLDLNPVQTAKLIKVREALVPVILKKQQAFQKSREVLLSQLRGEKMDAVAVQAETDATFDRLKQETDALIPLIADLQASLTKEQKEKLTEFK